MAKSKPTFIGTVRDMFTGNPVTYPNPKATKFAYDHIFTGHGAWNYVNSSQELNPPLVKKQNKTVEDSGEQWITLRPVTGEIVDHSKGALKLIPKIKSVKPRAKNTQHK